MDEFEFGVISDFLGNHWAQFLGFAEEMGLDEDQCDELANKLDAAAGRS